MFFNVKYFIINKSYFAPMFINIILLLNNLQKVYSSQVFHITFQYTRFKEIQNFIFENFSKEVDNECEKLKFIAEKKEYPWETSTKKLILFDNIFNWIFDPNKFVKYQHYDYIYQYMFTTIKKDIFNILIYRIRGKILTCKEYITIFAEITQNYINNKFGQIKIEDLKHLEMEVMVKNYCQQKIIKNPKMNISERKNYMINLRKGFIKYKVHLFLFQNTFFDINALIQYIKNIVRVQPQVRKRIFLDLNADLLFIIYFYSTNVSQSFQSIQKFLYKLNLDLKKSIEKSKNIQIKNEINNLKRNYQVEFFISKYKSDFLSIFYNYIKAENAETTNFSIFDLTNLVFIVQETIDEFLTSLFYTDEQSL